MEEDNARKSLSLQHLRRVRRVQLVRVFLLFRVDRHLREFRVVLRMIDRLDRVGLLVRVLRVVHLVQKVLVVLELELIFRVAPVHLVGLPDQVFLVLQVVLVGLALRELRPLVAPQRFPLVQGVPLVQVLLVDPVGLVGR